MILRKMKHVQTGLDRIRAGLWKQLKGYKLGLLANQASVDSMFNGAGEVISRLLPGQLKALFGPQHGYGGEDQDNMVETDHAYNNASKIPVFSLYAEKREPLPHMLEVVDILIIDLQDVGTRVYTFASTMLNCLKSAVKASNCPGPPQSTGRRSPGGEPPAPGTLFFCGAIQFSHASRTDNGRNGTDL